MTSQTETKQFPTASPNPPATMTEGVTVACAHCNHQKKYFQSFEHPGILPCLYCGKYTWTKLADGKIKSGKAYSKCPKKCKIGKLEPEIHEKIDAMMIQGWTYIDLIEQFPEAHLNIANFSTHKNKHMHPYFRQFMLTYKQEDESILTQRILMKLNQKQ